MTTTLGVISALLLTMEVGLLSAMPTDVLELGDLRSYMMHHTPGAHEFRAHMVDYLSQQNFNFTVPLRGRRVFDVQAALLTENPSADDMETAFFIIRGHYPTQMLYANLVGSASDAHSRYSYHFTGIFSALTTLCFTLTLCFSVVLYSSLILTDSHEKLETNPEILAAWDRYGLPAIMVCYFLLIPGTIFFYYSVSLYVQIVGTMTDVGRLWWIFIVPIYVPCGAVTLIIGFATYYATQKVAKVAKATTPNQVALP